MIHFINLLYMVSPDGSQQLQFTLEFLGEMRCGYAIEALANVQEGTIYADWSIHCYKTDVAYSISPIARPINSEEI